MKTGVPAYAGGILVVLLLLASGVSSVSVMQDAVYPSGFGSDDLIVLLTGFEPFDVYNVNPSQLVAEALDNTTVASARVVGIVLSVDYDVSVRQVREAIERYDPILVVSTGLSPGADAVEIEKIGVNLKTVELEGGRWSFPRRLNHSGPFLRVSPFPVCGLVRNLSEQDFLAEPSVFAGMYICNAVLYETLAYVETHDCSSVTGFVHLPLLDSQHPAGFPLEVLIDAVEQVMVYLLDDLLDKNL